MLIAIALAAAAATLLGGLFALKFRDQLHLVLGFSAGAVIGVAFFDLISEAINLGASYFSVSTLTSVVALGFAIFMVLDRLLLFHCHDGHGHMQRGKLGAGSLAVHSFLDGIAVGLAFQVSSVVGVVVAIAVLVHDFSDGINTVSLILKNDGGRKMARRWLAIDAAAPVLGIIATMFFTLPEQILGLILATFAGFFIYIGASDLLPESHHAHPTVWTTVMTVVGMAVLYGAVTLAGV